MAKILKKILKITENIQRHHWWKFQSDPLSFEEVRRIFSFIEVTFGAKNGQNFEFFLKVQKITENVQRHHWWKFQVDPLSFEEVKRIFSCIEVIFCAKNGQNFENKILKVQKITENVQRHHWWRFQEHWLNYEKFWINFWKFKKLLKMSKGIIGESFRLIR